MTLPPVLLLDFDGTATPVDVGGRLLRHFARDPSWQGIDNDYLTGRIGSRTAYRLAAELLSGDRAQWLAFARGASLDPGLRDLLDHARSKGWKAEILSDGLTFYIEALLVGAGLSVPVRANKLVVADGTPKVETPHMNPRCGRCGTCKTQRVETLAKQGHQVVYVGDGYSDQCAAPRAHRVFAKGVLGAHLAECGVPWEPFETLGDVDRALFGAAGQ